MCCGVSVELDEGDGEDHDGQKNRDQRFGVAGKIEVNHGVVRPFTCLDGTPPGKVYPVTDLSLFRWAPRNSYAPGPSFQAFSALLRAYVPFRRGFAARTRAHTGCATPAQLA